MSILGEKEASREEIAEYLRRRIAELEQEIKILKSLLALVDPAARAGEDKFDPDERTEEVKVSRKVIAKVGIGGSYVRLYLKFQAFLPDEIREYLENVVGEIAEKQALDGVPPEERARLEVKRGPEGEVRMILVENLSSPLEKVKAKAALKYVAELLYQLYRRRA